MWEEGRSELTDEEALKLLTDLALAAVCRGVGWTKEDGPMGAVAAIKDVNMATLQLSQRCIDISQKEEGEHNANDN